VRRRLGTDLAPAAAISLTSERKELPMSLDRYRNVRLIVTHPNGTVFDAARAMADHQVGSVLAGEETDLLGVVADGDLSLKIAEGDLDPEALPLSDIMSDGVASIDVGESEEDAAVLMSARHCRCLPVTEDGVLVGIVTLDDLILDGELDPALVRRAVLAQIDASLAPPASTADMSAGAAARRRARAEGTYGRLLHAVEDRTGLRERARAEEALRIALGSICRRLTPEEARHFIAQLPSRLHPELRGALDGPDKRIRLDAVQAELGDALGLGPSDASDVLFSLCETVAGGISAGEVRSVREQLPGPMKELFPQVPFHRAG
jgi:CBS domain-containing protein/uncharacterized protein (DUF2267 family)